MNNILTKLKKFIIKKNVDIIIYMVSLIIWLVIFTFNGFDENGGAFLPDQFEEITIPDNTVILLFSGATRSGISDSFLFYYQGKKYSAKCINSDIKNPKSPCSKFNLKQGKRVSTRGEKMIGTELKYFHKVNTSHGIFTNGKFIFLSDTNKKFEIIQPQSRKIDYMEGAIYYFNSFLNFYLILPGAVFLFLLFSWCWANYSHSLNQEKE
ncbi:hypothetical protein [Stenoxybacter acetivorans]|uniref:hypothetical protein n=1 Tax=Stenoxybacter acetivorans TaxID=422441 RepID=UPI000563A254|nr:hypothetical protein [Stenoxybacter acetivorans]